MFIVGHRGARNEAPENTVEGFVHAQQNGCMYFELDVQLSFDHELMVFHDTSLKRATGKRGCISKTQSRLLQTYDARLNTPGWSTPCHIPTLKQVVDSVPHTIHWQFEVKTDSRHRLSILARELATFINLNNLRQSVTVTSSDRWFLSHIQQRYEVIDRGYVAEWPIPNAIRTAQNLGCRLLCIKHTLANQKLVEEAHNAALQVSVWTVNSRHRMAEMNAIAVDSLITDSPSQALIDYPAH